ncbi:MAG: Ig-like domain-containing protein [Nitrospirales bacterium]
MKWLTKFKAVDYDYRGYWQREGWPEDATIKPQARIDLPGDRETVTTATYTVHGIAQGGASGIKSVEISTDLGATWQSATLSTPLSPHAWRLWTYNWQIPNPGEHTIIVRATNGQGTTQGKRLDDWHAVSIKAQI